MDLVFVSQKDGIPLFRDNGIRCHGWLPLACDPELHRNHSWAKRWDVCFVGHMKTTGRAELEKMLRARFSNHFVGQRFFREMAQIYAGSRIVLNLSVAGDVNMRVFEALASGSLLLTDDTGGNGLFDLFAPGHHLVCYNSLDDLDAKTRYYLNSEDERNQIASSGRNAVLARHTYIHRMYTLLVESLRELRGRMGPPARPSMSGPTVSIIIPVCDQLDHSRRCLESIRAHTSCRYELIVVDNGSREETSDYLASCDEIRVMRNPNNRGVPAAINQGVAASTGEIILLLNNDTIVTTGWVDRMLSAMQSDKRLGLVGPCSNVAPGAQRVDIPYASIDGLEEFAAKHGESHRGIIQEVKLLGGFCLMIRWTVFQCVGPFDEEFGIGTFDDYDFCCRAGKAGYRAAIAKDAFIHHVGSVTLNACNVDIPALLSRNERHFRHQWVPVGQGEQVQARQDSDLTSIVIVTWNAVKVTKSCIDSLVRCTPERIELIIVDNGSADGTVAYIEGLPNARIIKNDENRGFPAAANQGIRAARGSSVVLLNNNVILTPRWLSILLDALSSSPSVGIVGPCSNRVSGPQQVESSYANLNALEQFSRNFSEQNRGRREETDRLVGFCLLIRREVLDRVGCLDERFGIGNFEDDDFCLRVQRAGFEAVIAHDCFIHHLGSVSFREGGIDYKSLLETNRRLFQEKYSHPVAIESDESCVTIESPPLRLSLCMIVRNSSATLPACLKSIKPWVDEMIVVDTGSVDDTPRIAERFGAKVHYFPWCDDFSAARNESLKHAAGDWLLWMDSDDTITDSNGAALRRLFQRPIPSATMGFVLQVHCPASTSPGSYGTATVVDHVKLLRNLPGIRFRGRIHEQVMPAIRGLGGEVEWTDIFVVHSGSNVTPEGRARKHARDMRLLELELADEPDSSFTLFNLGMTLLDMGRALDALGPLSRSLQLSVDGESHVRKLYSLIMQSYTDLGCIKGALLTCAGGLEQFHGDPELLFRRGVIEHSMKKFEEAERSFRAVLADQKGRCFSSRDHGILGIKVWHNLALVYDQQRKPESAAQAWKSVLSFDNSNSMAWLGLINALQECRNWTEIELLSEAAATPPPIRGLAFP